MSDHDCIQDERIRNLTARVVKLEERIDTLKDDIKIIKEFQTKLLWAIIGVLITSSGTLILLLLKVKGLG